MSLSERAKIFVPFDPLDGYRQMLREREERQLVVERRELTDEQREQISRRIAALEPGDMVAVTHYVNGRYQRTTGCVSRVSVADGTLSVVGTAIPFDAIVAIDDVG